VHHLGAAVRVDRGKYRGLRNLTHTQPNTDVEKLSLVDTSTRHKPTSLTPDTSTVTEIKYSGVRQFSYSAGVTGERNAYKTLVDKSEKRRPLRRNKW
jgi:hypothetical protein